MRKLFSIFAAMLVALAVNATVTNITPTSPYESDALRLALYYSAEGDTIVMGEGIYEESNSDYIAFKRTNVVMAAEGAEVIIKPHVSFRVRNGARAELIGVKIDASELNKLSTSYENIFEVHDATAGNCWVLKNCEVYGNSAKTLLRHASSKTLDSVIIDGCYIHNNPQAILRLQDASLKGVIIKNSTFAEIANGGSFWCAPMDISTTAADAKVVVDHCTFYHNTSISSSYADVTVGFEGSATSDVTVSNCIIAQPEAYAGSRAINFTNGGVVKNCLVFNYTKSTNGIQGATSVTDCIYVDPLFVNAAEGNYTLGEGSPALTAAEDGGALGDPRWVPAAPVVNTKTIYFNEGVWGDADAARYEVYCITSESWVTLAAVEGEDHIFSAEILETTTQVVFCRMDPTLPEGQWSSLQNQTEDLTIPEGKDLFKITGWGEGWGAKCVGAWSKYGEEPVAPLEDGFYLVGKFGGVDAWDYASLNADKKFVWNAHIGEDNEEWKVVADLVEGDKVKACYVYNGAITKYFPAGEGNEYVVDANHAGNGKTIYFQQKHNEEWGGQFYIDPNSASAIDNTNAEMTVEKFFRDGQLIIRKNGVEYNAQGAVVK